MSYPQEVHNPPLRLRRTISVDQAAELLGYTVICDVFRARSDTQRPRK